MISPHKADGLTQRDTYVENLWLFVQEEIRKVIPIDNLYIMF